MVQRLSKEDETMVNQKATILCILEILQKYTDEDHRISTEKLREKLKMIYDVDMERRTIYRNIDALCNMGYDIQGYSDNREGYCLMDRTFEASEIRLLCDAVAASDMISPDTSKKLVKRLSEMLSVFQSRMLQRTVYVKEEKDNSNHKIFYNIDTLNIAINQGCKVSMKKLYHNFQVGLIPTKDSPMVFNPYATLWADGNYYVIGKEDGDEDLQHYRIDRLQGIEILEQTVEMVFGGINPNQYAERYIYNKGEQAGHFDIECDTSLWEELAECFEDDVAVLGFDHNKVQARVKSIPSTMKAWVLGRCDKCEVIAPKKFRDEVQSAVMEGYRKYWG